LQGYVDRISQVLDAQPEPVVLVGHSSGSMVIRKAAEQRPDKIEMLLYVGAYPLRNSEVALSAYGNYTKSLVLLKLAMSEDGLSTTLREEAIREGLLDDVSDENVERAKSRFEPQAVAALATPVVLTEDNVGRIPRVYIETLKNRAISPSLQKEMYEWLPCQKVISMNTGHWLSTRLPRSWWTT
jgi:pimeloyl-ACP methyl ester carboxylesterase